MNAFEVSENLLAMMRVSRFLLHTAHWQAENGAGFYGRHQVLSRAYTEIDADIDTFAEKLVTEYGNKIVDPQKQLELFNRICSSILDVTRPIKNNPIQVAEFVQKSLLAMLNDAYYELQSINALSLGMDDFIMASHNKYQNTYYLIVRSI